MSSCRSKASWSIASDLLPKRALPLSADLLCKSPAGQWMFRQFLLQFLDLISLRLDLCRQQLTARSSVGALGRDLKISRMGHLYPIGPSNRTKNTSKIHILLAYPACVGRHVRCGVRQSMPSSSIDSCGAVKCTLPSWQRAKQAAPSQGVS